MGRINAEEPAVSRLFMGFSGLDPV